MRIVIKYIYNIAIWSVFIVDAIILMIINLVVFAVTYPFDTKRKVIHACSYYWGLHYLWVNPFWKLDYVCRANIDPKKSYVIVSNHQSMLDICVIYKIPLVFKWVSKREVFRMPFVGWLLKLHGDILIQRGTSQSTREMLKKAEGWISKGCSISIFPEGTRSADGRIHDFKEGAFMIAKLNNLPILPVVIEGTRKILPPGSSLFGGCATARIHVLPEVTAETVASLKIRNLSDMLNSMMLEEHKRMAPEKYSGNDESGQSPEIS
ncbi:MAG: 1-acyl-sn-glycerol-3-phosphate acyltransferase [Prevotellaceae bacterium]|jgi:1-acyl-sn-glycerol-3-phosphate acyltransferase|nr:1-acyl-sn-glycerol-3-phosphate acyltransferase [Prevotellaceae bacterium]